jgi:GT2 family glycosyltransferase
MKVMFSIVIPNYNGRRLLERNLPEVLKAAKKQGKEFEVIVVDDASTDDSVSFLKKKFPQVKIVLHFQNQRFAAACNSGVQIAKGEVVVLLNNDVAPEPNFLLSLLTHFKDKDVFAVGCREKSKLGNKIIFSGRSEAKFEKGFLIHWRAENQDLSDTFWAAGGSMAVSREKWLKLGGMDPLFRPAYWEDIDLSWRAGKRGWKILFEPKSVVNHNHETTNIMAFGKKRMKVYAYKNQFLFVWKNGNARMILSNILWLSYHLLRATLSGDWLFWQGFFMALRQLPELVKQRRMDSILES